MIDTQHTPTEGEMHTPMEQHAPDIAPLSPSTDSAQPVILPKKRLPTNVYIIGGILLVAIFISAGLYIQSTQQAPQTPAAAPTPIVVITPTPILAPSRISSSSAFIAFQNAVASLSGKINSFTILDSTLTPPILNTDLGLSP